MKVNSIRKGEPLKLKELILKKYPSLPENQRKVADFLLQHQQDFAFLSVVEVEKKSGASKATVVRFAQSLGFSGFQELRDQLLEGVQAAILLGDKFPLDSRVDPKEALVLVAHQDVKNINQTINHLDRKVFHGVCDRILGATHVYTAGLGISSLMSQILAYSLNQVAVRASALVHDYETFLEQLTFLRPDDLLVVFSFPPYSRETLDLAKTAQAKKVAVVAITDRLTSPVTFYSVDVLPVRSHNMIFTNSFSAISVLINAIATEVAMKNEGKAMKNINELHGLLSGSGYYSIE